MPSQSRATETPEQPLVGWRLLILGTLMRRVLDQALQPLDTSADQVQALDCLALVSPLTVGQLARHLGLERNSGSQLVERLVQRGWVTRTRSPDDRRQVAVALTVAGMALLHTVTPTVLAVNDALAGALGPADVATAARLMAEGLALLHTRLLALEPGELTQAAAAIA